MNAIIYVRVSSKEQIEGTSLESQQAACLEYANANRMTVAKVFIEKGESAKFADRTQLLELMDFCRTNKGKVNILLVWKIDRFARVVNDHFSIKAMLSKYGVRIVSVTEPIEDSPTGRLMETMLAGFAQFDNDIRAARTVQGMRRKLLEGIFPWQPPLGYQSVQVGEKKTRPDVPDPTRFGAIQRAWRLFAGGDFSKRHIHQLLGQWGVTTRKGKPLSYQSVDEMFSNSYYAGIISDPWSGIERQGLHTPMITPEEFARVQQIIKGKGKSTPHVAHREAFPLRGVVRCVACNQFLTAAFSRGRRKRYAYYNCFNRGCGKRGKALPAQSITDEFASLLRDITPSSKCLAAIPRVAQQAIETEKANAGSERNVRRIEQINREIAELIRLRTQGMITDADFRVHHDQLLNERNNLLAAWPTASPALYDVDQKYSEIKASLSDLPSTWRRFKGIQRLRFERLVLPTGFANGSIRTAPLGDLFTFFRGFGQENSNEVPLGGDGSNHLIDDIFKFWALMYDPTSRDARESMSSRRYRPNRRRYRKRYFARKEREHRQRGFRAV